MPSGRTVTAQAICHYDYGYCSLTLSLYTNSNDMHSSAGLCGNYNWIKYDDLPTPVDTNDAPSGM